MISPRTARSIEGAWRVFLGDRSALSAFDLSTEGFWNSFGAIVFTAPTYLLIVLFDEQARLAADPPLVVGGALYAARATAFVLDLATMPVLLALCAAPLGIATRYPSYVIVRNWGSVLTALPFAALAILSGYGLMPSGLGSLFSVVILIVVLRFHVEMARITLGWTLGPAIGLAATEFVLGVFLVALIDAFFGI